MSLWAGERRADELKAELCTDHWEGSTRCRLLSREKWIDCVELMSGKRNRSAALMVGLVKSYRGMDRGCSEQVALLSEPEIDR